MDDAAPGLRDHEACLLRLLEKVTNGTVVEINETGAAAAPTAVGLSYAARAREHTWLQRDARDGTNARPER